MIAHLRSAKIHSFYKKAIKLMFIIQDEFLIKLSYIFIVKTYKHSP